MGEGFDERLLVEPGREGKDEVNEEHEEEFGVGEEEQVSPFAKCSVTNKHTGP